ncbi:MAG: hypothetical protein PHU08_07565 [Dehalococcoidales bacterium]|jgi:uncharacterized membrane protein|nr:hypothetical protein [Dehalococcoidales bacterium]
MQFLPTALVVVVGVLALILILKSISGCLLRIILFGAVIALAVFLVFRFLLD